MSRSLGTQRLGLIHSTGDLLLLRKTWPFIRVAVATLALCAIAPRHLLRRHNAVILSLLIGYVILQNVFAELTLNDVENSVAYVGLLNASAFILLTRIFWTSTQYPVREMDQTGRANSRRARAVWTIQHERVAG